MIPMNYADIEMLCMLNMLTLIDASLHATKFSSDGTTLQNKVGVRENLKPYILFPLVIQRIIHISLCINV